MTTANANVKMRVEVLGVGDADVKIKRTREQVKGLAEDAKSVERQGLSQAREGFDKLAKTADEKVLKVREGFHKLIEVGGLVTGAVAGIAAGISALNDMQFAAVRRELAQLATSVGTVGQAFADAAAFAGRMRTEAQRATITALTAEIASARARGDDKRANTLAAQLTTTTSGYEAGGLRGEAAATRVQANKLEESRLKAIDLIAQNADRIREIESYLGGGPTSPEMARGGGGRTIPALREELAGLKALQPALQISLQGMSAIAAEQVGAATARLLDKAANAVEQAGIDEARNILSGGKAKTPGGGGGGGGAGGRGVVGGVLGTDAGAVVRKARNLREALLIGDQEFIDAAFAGDKKKSLSANDNAYATEVGSIDTLVDTERIKLVNDLADGISSVGAALSGLSSEVPGIERFGVALDDIAGLWRDYGKAGFSAANATAQSVGAIAKAGAQFIKNERTRAGVLAVIETGLGLATAFTNPAESAGHFAAAAVLGGVAIFGGSSGGGGTASQRDARSTQVAVGQTLGQGAMIFNVNAPWFGGLQEGGAYLWQVGQRVAGTGYAEAD